MEKQAIDFGRLAPLQVPGLDVRERVQRIVRWAGAIAGDLPNDFMVQQLAHDALDLLVGPDAIHTQEAFKTPDMRDWADELLAEALRAANRS